MNFIGNSDVVRDIKLALYKPLTSYILQGDKGLGKATLGRDFAKKLLCKSNRKNDCSCDSCRRFDSNNHPDFNVITVEEGAKSIKIDQIRKVVNSTYLCPNLSVRKVYFIDDANLLTIEAQNALLKTLEEGFQYATFIFIAHKPLLFTINSRSTIFQFKPLSKSLIRQSIEKDLVIAAVNGIGRGLTLQEDEKFLKEGENLLASLIKIPRISEEQFLESLGLFKEKSNEGLSESDYLDELLHITHHFIFDLIKHKLQDNKVIFKSLNKERLKPFSNYSLKTLEKAYSLVLEGISNKDKNLFTKDDLFFMFFSLINFFKEEDLCQ